jgi:hypothetical protein
MYLTMKFGLSRSYYCVFEPEIPNMYTDGMKKHYEIYIIISLVLCIPDYDVMLSRNYIKLSIIQKETWWTVTAQSMHIHHKENSHTRIWANDHPVAQQIVCLSWKSTSNIVFKRTQHLSLASMCVFVKDPVNTLAFNLILDSHLYYSPIC